MRKTAAVVLLLITPLLYGAKSPKHKVKEKRFEPVTVTAAQVVGSYRGPAEDYRIVLELTNDGLLRGTYLEMGRRATLAPFRLDGSEFTTRATFEDGTSRALEGSFANRILNGVTAFGMRVHDVNVPGYGVINTFFPRL